MKRIYGYVLLMSRITKARKENGLLRRRHAERKSKKLTSGDSGHLGSRRSVGDQLSFCAPHVRVWYDLEHADCFQDASDRRFLLDSDSPDRQKQAQDQTERYLDVYSCWFYQHGCLHLAALLCSDPRTGFGHNRADLHLADLCHAAVGHLL